jgi:succinyl-CoA synthetase alpha subunit
VAIIVDSGTRLVVQGLTGSEGRFHGLRNRAYGTNLVAGVTPGKGGQDVEGVPVFNTSQTGDIDTADACGQPCSSKRHAVNSANASYSENHTSTPLPGASALNSRR